MQENRQHTHKIVTQNIPWETLIEGKTQPPKASITMYYSIINLFALILPSFNFNFESNESIISRIVFIISEIKIYRVFM